MADRRVCRRSFRRNGYGRRNGSDPASYDILRCTAAHGAVGESADFSADEYIIVAGARAERIAGCEGGGMDDDPCDAVVGGGCAVCAEGGAECAADGVRGVFMCLVAVSVLRRGEGIGG